MGALTLKLPSMIPPIYRALQNHQWKMIQYEHGLAQELEEHE
jgi:hypothetical protein